MQAGPQPVLDERTRRARTTSRRADRVPSKQVVASSSLVSRSSGRLRRHVCRQVVAIGHLLPLSRIRDTQPCIELATSAPLGIMAAPPPSVPAYVERSSDSWPRGAAENPPPAMLWNEGAWFWAIITPVWGTLAQISLQSGLQWDDASSCSVSKGVVGRASRCSLRALESDQRCILLLPRQVAAIGPSTGTGARVVAGFLTTERSQTQQDCCTTRLLG